MKNIVMKEITTTISLLEDGKVVKVPALIKYTPVDEDTTYIYVKISITYNEKKYVGVGSDYLWVDAFADLQYKLPDNVRLACCMTCKYGNMCPYGNEERELFCTKGLTFDDKLELAGLFSDKSYEKLSVLADSYCDDYEPQSYDYFTYNDYVYVFDRKYAKPLLKNIDKIHLPEAIFVAIKDNLDLDEKEILEYCKNKILDKKCNIYFIERNWHCEIDNILIMIDAHNFEISGINITK